MAIRAFNRIDETMNRNDLQNYMKPEKLPQTLVVVVVATSLLSVVFTGMTGGAVGKTLTNWLGTYMSDLSSDLIGAWFMMIFMRFMVSKQPLVADEVIDAPEAMTILEGVSVEKEAIPETFSTKPIMEVEQIITELKSANTAEARQLWINRLRTQGASLRDIHLVDVELGGANLDSTDLEQANFTKARLRSASLRGANLRGVTFYMAQLIESDLQGADLSEANLERTFMSGANLRGARLVGARVQCSLWGVDLQNADLQNADLTGAELFRTDLRGANLQGVRLVDATINNETTLPDGQLWDHRIDMMRFVNPDHPNFWRSDDPNSPARG
jgi:uncharacterized protein YjbI with pentapeptide repeats